MSDNADQILELIEVARETGKIRKGINEATKAVERGEAQLIIYAEDVDPKEIAMHLPPLCEEKKIPCVTVPNKDALGRAAGIDVSTAAIAVLDAGDAKNKISEVTK